MSNCCWRSVQILQVWINRNAHAADDVALDPSGAILSNAFNRISHSVCWRPCDPRFLYLGFEVLGFRVLIGFIVRTRWHAARS